MPNVTLKITMGAFSVEVTGPEKYAETKLEELVGRYLTSSRPGTTEASTISSQSSKPSGKKLAPAEFLRTLAHKNQRDRALALGYFIEKIERAQNFTTGDLKALESKIKYPFANISDIVTKLVSRGFMMNAGDKEGQRAYALTASGEIYVESLMESKPPKSKP
jgi:hypothetical protein